MDVVVIIHFWYRYLVLERSFIILLFLYGFVNFVMDYYQNVVLFCSCDVTRGACLLSLSTSLEVLVLVLDVLLVKGVDAT